MTITSWWFPKIKNKTSGDGLVPRIIMFNHVSKLILISVVSGYKSGPFVVVFDIWILAFCFSVLPNFRYFIGDPCESYQPTGHRSKICNGPTKLFICTHAQYSTSIFECIILKNAQMVLSEKNRYGIPLIICPHFPVKHCHFVCIGHTAANPSISIIAVVI